MRVIGILDIGVGNLRSMYNAVHQSGFDPLVVGTSSEFDGLSHLVIPGVGNFAAAMSALATHTLIDGIREFASSGRPLLGVCLGMQLLATQGEESGIHEGLGLIPGTVRRLAPANELRLPHVGWNVMQVTRPHPVFGGLKGNRDFYYVHSYGVTCEVDEDVLGVTDYGGPVTAAAGRGNVIGVQFHPEKSQVNGLKVIENFCLWDGRC